MQLLLIYPKLGNWKRELNKGAQMRVLGNDAACSHLLPLKLDDDSSQGSFLQVYQAFYPSMFFIEYKLDIEQNDE